MVVRKGLQYVEATINDVKGANASASKGERSADLEENIMNFEHWIDAMNAEMDALYRNNTWELGKAIGSKWGLKIKNKLDESSGIGNFHTLLDDDASCEHSQEDIKSKAFINRDIGQLSLNQKKQHVFNVLNAKPFEISFFEFVEFIIISTYSDPIQMHVVMPFDDLKLSDSDDSTFGLDISSRFPIDCKSIELLTFEPPMLDSPERLFVIANRYLTPHCTRYSRPLLMK
nr:hypothetical protein [Tanacetum cinerariifolium]